MRKQLWLFSSSPEREPCGSSGKDAGRHRDLELLPERVELSDEELRFIDFLVDEAIEAWMHDCQRSG